MMGRQQCKKHPKHRQSPGVCSLCLSDKLSKVSNSGTASRSAIIRARARVYYESSSSSSLSSSYDSSTAASPVHHVVISGARHRRIVSDVRANNVIGYNTNSKGGSVFSKSKSMAHVEKERLRSDDSNNYDDKKKNMKKNVKKLWANLLRLGRNEEKRVNAHVNDRKIFQPHQLQSSSSMVVY
ncbi:uncharacterized protein LOC110709695 [Chenopodium quinoa]|uniref:uncharacterized protein LOC110709695 n=1 Tax=Chenopodium quinoa TaxID=63459 RepID=UPI000B781F2D|nr:uncharacterized protein LOC110709695 [Chenopodium quinoa]